VGDNALGLATALIAVLLIVMVAAL